MSDPLQDYRDAVSALIAASNRTFAAHQELQAATEAENEARNAKTRAERAMHQHILSTNPQQLPLGVTQQ